MATPVYAGRTGRDANNARLGPKSGESQLRNRGRYAVDTMSFLLRWLPSAAVLTVVLLSTPAVSATEVRISAKALERTLRTQLFTGPQGRYYMKGDASSPCYVYASDPHVAYKDDRIVVQVKTRARLGTSLRGTCIGVGLSDEAEVSLLPDAEGETIGFRDARIEHISENRELNFLMSPFLKSKLPAQLKVNAAELMRKVLSGSAEKTGYTLTLSSLKLHSLLVEGGSLVLDVDSNLSVD